MKTMILAGIAVLSLSGLLQAQVGAKADMISIPSYGRAATVLRHCEAIEELPDAVKVRHEDGVWNVPLQFLPEQWQKALQSRKDAAAAAERKKLAEQEEDRKLVENRAEDTGSTRSEAAAAPKEPGAVSRVDERAAANDKTLAKREIVIVRIPRVVPPGVRPAMRPVSVIPVPPQATVSESTTSRRVWRHYTTPSFKIKGVDDSRSYDDTAPDSN